MLHVSLASYAPLRNPAPSNSRFVTKQLNDWITAYGHGYELRLDQELNILFGDPCPGERKQLVVRYRCGDRAQERAQSWIEGQRVLIDARAILSPASSSPTPSRSPTPEFVRHEFPNAVLSVIVPFLPIYPDGLNLRLVCREWDSRIKSFGLAVVFRAMQHAVHQPPSFVELVIGRSRSSLRVLDLAGFSKLADVNLATMLASFTRLEELDLSDCTQLSEQALLSAVASCPRLEMLTMKRLTAATDAVVCRAAESCPRLSRLDLSECKSITDVALGAVGARLGELQALFLMENHLVTDDGVLSILRGRASALSELSLRGLHRVTEAAFAPRGRILAGLSALTLAGCARIDDAALEAVAVAVRLVSMDVMHCVRVTDVGIVAAVRSMPLLQHLNLNHALRISDAALAAVGEHCTMLRSLDVSFCGKLSAAGIAAMATRLPQLSEVHMRGCVQLGDDAVAALAQTGGDSLSMIDARNCPLVTAASLGMLKTQLDGRWGVEGGCYFR